MAFQVPDGPAFREERVITAVARDDFAGAWPDVLDELARRVSVTGQT